MIDMKGMKVLLVDDEVLLSMEMRMTLQEMGYVVTGDAISGEEALEMAGRERPDIALVDLRLAGRMDGIETVRALMREHSVPSIILTGNTDEQTSRLALAAGPLAILRKPVPTDVLAGALRKAAQEA